MAEEQLIQKKGKRVVPQTELDLQLLTTDSVWGKEEVSNDLKTKLSKYFKVKTADGREGYTTESLWGLLGFYTRDMRLANLSNRPYNDEMGYCEYHLNLANDFLQKNMIGAFVIALSRVATKLELSQSKGGFLRKSLNTFRQESEHRELEPPKKSLFGTPKKKEAYQ